jgi:hypothetical protein
MKNFNLFMNEKKEKLKIAGSIVGGVTIIALSSCNVSNVKNDSSSVETSILSSVSTTTIQTNNTSSYSTTSNKTQTTKKETTTQTTTTSTTTKAPETITTTTNEVIITPNPVTTNIPATEKPVESTTKVTTKVTQTTTKTNTTKKEEPIEYETRTDEIKGYYDNVKLNNVTKLTKQNINNYDDFMNIVSSLYYKTSAKHENNSLSFLYYHVYYNLDNGRNEKSLSDSYIEKIIFLTMLNENELNNENIKKILKPYTIDELKGLCDNMMIIFDHDIQGERYYEYSNIIADEKLASILTNVQNSFIKKDYNLLQKLCNDNYGKYNMFIDAILIEYESLTNYITDFPCGEMDFDLARKSIEQTGIYDRAHQKVLVKQ